MDTIDVLMLATRASVTEPDGGYLSRNMSLYYQEKAIVGEGKIWVHQGHGNDEREGNLRWAQRFAALGLNVYLEKVNEVDGIRSFDATIGGNAWEFKQSQSADNPRSIERLLADGQKQAPYVAVEAHPETSIGTFTRGVDKFRRNHKLRFEEIWLCFGGNILPLSQSQLMQISFERLAERLLNSKAGT